MPELKPEDVTGSLPSYDFEDSEVTLAIRRTRAWIADAKELDELPAELTEADWADAVEIAIMVVTNPEAFSQKTVGQTGRMWPIVIRRDEVIERVRRRAQRAHTGPRGSYPPAPTYPDPAIPLGGAGGLGDGYHQPPVAWIVRP